MTWEKAHILECQRCGHSLLCRSFAIRTVTDFCYRWCLELLHSNTHAYKIRELHFNSGNATDDMTLHDTPFHSGSTQLNYEWRSIPREGKRVVLARGAPPQGKVAFAGK